jgi:hypothetical protein
LVLLELSPPSLSSWQHSAATTVRLSANEIFHLRCYFWICNVVCRIHFHCSYAWQWNAHDSTDYG